jgi:thiol-disulfide isomerase/thioredoxin
MSELNSLFTNYTVIGTTLAVVILLVLVGIGYYFFVVKKKKLSMNKKDDGKSNKDIEILFFFTDWCPHCKTAKPEYESVKADYDGKEQNGYTIKFKDVNCTKESDEVEQLTNLYKIEGYPTIKLVKDNEIIEYDAKPNKDTLIQFIHQMV